jgi:hypothetical protein
MRKECVLLSVGLCAVLFQNEPGVKKVAQRNFFSMLLACNTTSFQHEIRKIRAQFVVDPVWIIPESERSTPG